MPKTRAKRAKRRRGDPALKVEWMSIDRVIPYVRNPRVNEAAVEKVLASIKEFGWRQPIVVDKDLVVVAGHARLKAARQLNLQRVPVHVAKKEMGLLYVSIRQDGYTQPIVTIYDPDKAKYVIVDGFHRYFIGKSQEDIRERVNGYLPVVVIDKPMNDRMAATIGHNRARGEHTIGGMSKLVFQMLDGGWSDADICNHLGLEAEELLKLKHITGFSALFKDGEYSRAWETKKMVRMRVEYERQHGKPAHGK